MTSRVEIMSMNRRRFLMLTAAALAPLPALAGTTVMGGHAFGSYWRALVPENAGEERVQALIAGVIAKTDRLMSPWRADSEITRFNHAGSGRVSLSPETHSVLQASLSVARRTRGAFDPTVGPLVARYGFGPVREGQAGRWEDLEPLAAEGVKTRSDLTLDLCGIAKGHALDNMVAALDAGGLTDFVIELGGEVAARGRHPDGRPWQVAVDGGGGPSLIVAPGELALATSGLGEQGYEIGGRRIGHIIDPAQGRPAEDSLRAVTVLCPTATEADGLATAFFAMGRARATELALREGIPAIFSLPGGGVETTGGAEDFVIGETPA
ncbi:FAD:protein FMN transferase [Histidinibacterium aquaticum]|uniref:FAD:protein FMN transferase n=1 Tax=Histidinibacterium aquaticum TaxID=2613962 RepID=A0A5J5GM35_9RHOB|nr:FAD:protein FMN transferase [Histidinibacterium aquaticum]KAA9009416.1 FAD:protein FMN transferase [Histidinibacterium aquaticum]